MPGVARAPGKLVLSGAYSVLEGAPAIVAAVDRFATADAGRAADRVTDEVRAAIEAGVLERAPWFDASPLRCAAPTADDPAATRKLGLGSSAAILVASIAACIAEAPRDEGALRRLVLDRALAAHRRAQHGGSGVDVAASVHGGVVACRILGPASSGPLARTGDLQVQPHALPAAVVLRVFASRTEAKTSTMLAQVRDHARARAADYDRAMARAIAGAEAALAARDVASFVAALTCQALALAELGRAAGAPIVTPDVERLALVAAEEGAAFVPSGAGGGDIALYVGPAEPSAELVARALEEGLYRLEIAVGARGVHRMPIG